MKRLLVVVVLGALLGCGSSNPAGDPGEPPPAPGVEMTSVRVAELEAYINAANVAYGSIEVMTLEYGGVINEALLGLVPIYWSKKYTENLILRVKALQVMLANMRPENPELRRLHIEEFEAAFEDYLDGITYFESQLDFLTSGTIDELNNKMGAGNVHLIRLGIFLSDLAGRQVILGSGATEEVFPIQAGSGASSE
jgi:hypothetical protein